MIHSTAPFKILAHVRDFHLLFVNSSNRKQFHTIIDDLLITLDFCVAVFCDTTGGEPEAEKVRVFELEL